MIGYATQIHKKTDKRVTWTYHAVDRWYLSTSPEHDRTHVYYIKTIRSERLADTVQFSHKNITNPTIAHANKVMNAIADCAKATKGATQSDNKTEMRQLKQLVELTKQAV